MKHHYSRHAPRLLVRQIETAENPHQDGILFPLHVLLSRESEAVMLPVWKTLTRREIALGHTDAEKALNEGAMYLWTGCLAGLRAPPPEKRKTRQQHARDMMAISGKAREIAALIEESFFMSMAPVVELFTDDDLVKISKVLDATKAMAESAMAEQRPISEVMRTRLAIAGPRIVDVLQSLARLADDLAKVPPTVRKVNVPNYREVFFCRTLTSMMVQRYGQPLHATVAAVGSLFFGDVMTEEFVRKNAPAFAVVE